MADDKESLFTVNAGQILAKLHLAAKLKAGNFIAINTGMKADADIAPDAYKPDEKNVIFDMSNKTGEYELCFVSKQPFERYEQIVLSAAPEVQKAKENAQKAKNDLSAAEEDVQNSSITAQSNDTQQEKKKAVTAEQDVNVAVANATGVKIKKDATSKERKEAIAKANEERAKQAEKLLNGWKKTAIAEMNSYFEAFCGKDAKKISEKDLVVVQFPKEATSFKDFKIKDFKVQGMPDADLKKWQEEAAKHQDKPSQMKIGFKVAYSVEVETM